MTRTAARHIAVQLGFASAAALLPAEEVAEVFFEPTHYATLAEEDPLYAEPPSPSEEAFILDCIRGIEECREELDAYIGKYAKSWKVKTNEENSHMLSQTVYSPNRYMWRIFWKRATPNAAEGV